MPNIVMISLDDLNDWTATFGGYAGLVHTPNLDRLAAMGTSFANAFTAVPLCNPARSAVLSGWGPLTTGVFNNEQDMFDLVDVRDTLPAVLRDAGYATVTAGKVFHELGGAQAAVAYDDVLLPQPRLAGILDERTVTPFEVAGDFVGGVYRPLDGDGPDDGLGDLRVTTAVETFLAGYTPEAGGPGLFLSVGLTRPHLPYVAPQEYFDLYPLDEIVLPDAPSGDLLDTGYGQILAHLGDIQGGTTDELKRYVQGYLAAISFGDALLGRMLDALEASAIADSTVVVLWSDHGYHLGEKETFGKFTLWEEAARAPLIIADPRAAATHGTVSEQVVSLLDIFPTVLDFAGVTSAPRDGQSLRTLVETNDATGLDGGALTAIAGSYSWRTATHRYTRYADGTVELYNLRVDPEEYDNLAGDPDAAEVETALANALDAHLDTQPFQRGVAGQPQRLIAAPNERVLVAANAADTLVGGAADNVYLVAPGVRLIEELDGGFDRVLTTGDFALPGFVENLAYAPVGSPEDTPVRLAGNVLANRIGAVSGRTTVIGGGGDDTLDGGNNVDLLLGGSGADRLAGGKGNDVLAGGRGNDTLLGGEGDDRYVAAFGHDVIEENGISRHDVVDVAAWGRDNIRLDWLRDAEGTLQSLRLSRTGRADTITITVAAGELTVDALVDGEWQQLLQGQTVIGGTAAETILGSDDNDRIFGEDGDDLLAGGGGRDRLDGGDGDDTLLAGADDPSVIGGAGRDVASFAAADKGVRVDLGDMDGAFAGIEVLFGSAFDDRLAGDDRRNDIHGGSGRDCIEGGADADLLVGGAGLDTLVGGMGNDRFAFLGVTDSGDQRGSADIILEFNPAHDVLLFGRIDADPATAANDAFQVVSGGFDTAGQLRIEYGIGTTYVLLNTDADAAAEMIVRLQGTLTLGTANFVL